MVNTNHAASNLAQFSILVRQCSEIWLDVYHYFHIILILSCNGQLFADLNSSGLSSIPSIRNKSLVPCYGLSNLLGGYINFLFEGEGGGVWGAWEGR